MENPMHKSLFFSDPPHYEKGKATARTGGARIDAVVDNDYETATTVNDIDIDTSDADGNPTLTEFVFVKGKGITNYTITPSGGVGTGFANRSIPANVTNLEGNFNTAVINGYQHDLYQLPTPFTSTEIRLRFSGTGATVTEILFLELLFEMDAHTDVNPVKVDRTGNLQENNDGDLERFNLIDAERWKWMSDYESLFDVDDTPTFLDFMDLIRKKKPVVFAQSFTEYPARVYPAYFPGFEFVSQYRGANKNAGTLLNWQISEQ